MNRTKINLIGNTFTHLTVLQDLNIDGSTTQIRAGNQFIVINDLMQIVNPFLSDDIKKQLYDNIKAPDLSSEDAEVKDNNSKLITTAYTNLGYVFVIALILCLVLAYFYKLNLVHILQLNLIIVVLIGLTKYIFLHFVPHKYILADTNWVRWKILSSIRSKLIFPS